MSNAEQPESNALVAAARALLNFGHPELTPEDAEHVEAWNRLNELVLAAEAQGCGEAQAVPPRAVLPWASKEGGSVVRTNHDKRQITLTFDRKQEFDAMDQWITSSLLGPPKSTV